MVSPYVPILGYKGSMRKRTVVTQTSILPVLMLALALHCEPDHLRADVSRQTPGRIVMGAEDGWRALIDRESVMLRPGRRGYLDITLERFRHNSGPTTELLLQFDSTPLRDAAGRYDVVGGAQELTMTAHRTGAGALLVDGPEDRLVLNPGPLAAFAPGAQWGSFSIEFWFYPVALDDLGTILRWRARDGAAHGFRVQEVAVEIDAGTTVIRFDDFFIRPDGTGTTIALRGPGWLVPRTWAHHLVRFDASTGLLEYLVDGRPVDLTHVSETGRQDGSVFSPRVFPHPEEGIVLADGLIGMLDELRIEHRFVDDPSVRHFPPQGGRVVTESYDLGSTGAQLISIDAVFDAPGLSDVFLWYQLSDRAADAAAEWVPARSGDPIVGAVGRYLRLRAELLPDTRADIAPSLSQITVTYRPDPPPLPPAAVWAAPLDGAVLLEWAPVQESDVEGYLVYYGDEPGRYFGSESLLGESPIDVGPANSVVIDGLTNGTLYFFAVQVYRRSFRPAQEGTRSAGAANLSQEAAARPAKVYR